MKGWKQKRPLLEDQVNSGAIAQKVDCETSLFETHVPIDTLLVFALKLFQSAIHCQSQSASAFKRFNCFLIRGKSRNFEYGIGNRYMEPR